MHRPMRFAIGALCLAALATAAALAPAQATRDAPAIVTIATGSRAGVYYEAGGLLCDLVNRERWSHGLRCLVESTEGSVSNLRALRAGTADFAIVQSDVLRDAVAGQGEFGSLGPDRALRSVLPLHAEAFALLVRPDAEIRDLPDLRGKRVDLGPPGSGGRHTLTAAMDVLDMSSEDFAYVGASDASEAPQALCRGDVDATVLMIAHPNLVIEEATRLCGARLVSISAPVLDALTVGRPAYFEYVLPGGTYPGQTSSLRSFAAAAVLVASVRTPPSVVRTLAAASVGPMTAFRAQRAGDAALDQDASIGRGLVAPRHPGSASFGADR